MASTKHIRPSQNIIVTYLLFDTLTTKIILQVPVGLPLELNVVLKKPH